MGAVSRSNRNYKRRDCTVSSRAGEVKMSDILRIVLEQSNQICIECGRKFDMFDEEQAAEWHAGHDCEVLVIGHA